MPDNWIGRILFKDGDFIVDDAGEPMHTLINLSKRKNIKVSRTGMPVLCDKLSKAQGIVAPDLPLLPFINKSLSPNGTQISMIGDLGYLEEPVKGFIRYDFSRVDTLWQDVARTIPVTAAGQLVKLVDNISTVTLGSFAMGFSGNIYYGVDNNGLGYLYNTSSNVDRVIYPDLELQEGYDITATTRLYLSDHIPTFGTVYTTDNAIESSWPVSGYLNVTTLQAGQLRGNFGIDLYPDEYEVYTPDLYVISGNVPNLYRLFYETVINDMTVMDLAWPSTGSLEGTFYNASLRSGELLWGAWDSAFKPTSLKESFYGSSFVVTALVDWDVTAVTSANFVSMFYSCNAASQLVFDNWQVSTITPPGAFNTNTTSPIPYNNLPRWKYSYITRTFDMNGSNLTKTAAGGFLSLASNEDTNLKLKAASNMGTQDLQMLGGNLLGAVHRSLRVSYNILTGTAITNLQPYRVYVEYSGIGWVGQDNPSSNKVIQVDKGVYISKVVLTSATDNEIEYQRVKGVNLLVDTPCDSPLVVRLGILPYSYMSGNQWKMLERFRTGTLTSITNTFNGLPAISPKLDVSAWDTSKITELNSIFGLMSSINRPWKGMTGIGSWNLPALKNVYALFRGADCVDDPSLGELILNMDFSTCTNATNLFSQANFGTAVDYLVNFHTPRMEVFDYMFESATVYSPLPLLTFDSATSLKYMFNATVGFNQPLGNKTLSYAVREQGSAGVLNMFKGATSYTQDLSSWELKNSISTPSYYDLGGSNGMTVAQYPVYVKVLLEDR